jgi:outer membrane protein assembly factor BamB
VRLLTKTFVVFASCVALSACSIFSDKEEDLEPLKLTKIDTTLKVKKLWTANLGGDSEHLRVALQPAGDGNRIYATSHDGNVTAFDPVSGKRIWRTELDLEMSAGPGVGDGLVVVASNGGIVIVLDATTGEERWRADVGGESLSRPLVANDSVIIQTVDNRLRALSAFDGNERWVIIQSMPALTIRGSSSPVMSGANVVAGFDNGRVVAVDLASGGITWEALLAPPSGRSDLDRLSDVDGAMVVVGQDIYAAGYQGRLGSIAAESGQILWSTEISSYAGVSVDWTSLYTTQDTGVVISMARRNGAESWRQESLLRREPTVPVPFHTTVVVADLEGFIHFFNNLDGAPVARLKLGSKAISSDPVVIADRLYVQSDSGSIAAYVVDMPKRPIDAPDIAEDEGA